MNKYTICCTPEQTRKALELGAPIRIEKVHDVLDEYSLTLAETTHDVIHNPTAEQMIGWLEDQGLFVTTDKSDGGHYFYKIEYGGKYICEWNSFSSRKKATRAAINAALEYLINKK